MHDGGRVFSNIMDISNYGTINLQSRLHSVYVIWSMRTAVNIYAHVKACNCRSEAEISASNQAV